MIATNKNRQATAFQSWSATGRRSKQLLLPLSDTEILANSTRIQARSTPRWAKRSYDLSATNHENSPLQYFDELMQVTLEWKSLEPKPQARRGHAAVIVDGMMVIHGGKVKESNLGDLNCFDIGTPFPFWSIYLFVEESFFNTRNKWVEDTSGSDHSWEIFPQCCLLEEGIVHVWWDRCSNQWGKIQESWWLASVWRTYVCLIHFRVINTHDIEQQKNLSCMKQWQQPTVWWWQCLKRSPFTCCHSCTLRVWHNSQQCANTFTGLGMHSLHTHYHHTRLWHVHWHVVLAQIRWWAVETPLWSIKSDSRWHCITPACLEVEISYCWGIVTYEFIVFAWQIWGLTN